NIFSYTHRVRLCGMAYHNTRSRLLAERDAFERLLAKHGIGLNIDRLSEPHRAIEAALTDPRALFLERLSVKSTAKALQRTLDALTSRGRSPPGGGGDSQSEGGAQTPPPHARADHRNLARALQSLRRASHHDGGHRGRDGDQPGQSLLSLPQQGR